MQPRPPVARLFEGLLRLVGLSHDIALRTALIRFASAVVVIGAALVTIAKEFLWDASVRTTFLYYVLVCVAIWGAWLLYPRVAEYVRANFMVAWLATMLAIGLVPWLIDAGPSTNAPAVPAVRAQQIWTIDIAQTNDFRTVSFRGASHENNSDRSRKTPRLTRSRGALHLVLPRDTTIDLEKSITIPAEHLGSVALKCQLSPGPAPGSISIFLLRQGKDPVPLDNISVHAPSTHTYNLTEHAGQAVTILLRVSSAQSAGLELVIQSLALTSAPKAGSILIQAISSATETTFDGSQDRFWLNLFRSDHMLRSVHMTESGFTHIRSLPDGSYRLEATFYDVRLATVDRIDLGNGVGYFQQLYLPSPVPVDVSVLDAATKAGISGASLVVTANDRDTMPVRGGVLPAYRRLTNKDGLRRLWLYPTLFDDYYVVRAFINQHEIARHTFKLQPRPQTAPMEITVIGRLVP